MCATSSAQNFTNILTTGGGQTIVWADGFGNTSIPKLGNNLWFQAWCSQNAIIFAIIWWSGHTQISHFDNLLVSDGLTRSKTTRSIASLRVSRRVSINGYHQRRRGGCWVVPKPPGLGVRPLKLRGRVVVTSYHCNGAHRNGQIPYFKSDGEYRKKECIMFTYES